MQLNELMIKPNYRIRDIVTGEFYDGLLTLVGCDSTIRNTELLAIRTGSDHSGSPHHRSTLTYAYSNTDGALSGSRLTTKHGSTEHNNMRPERSAADEI